MIPSHLLILLVFATLTSATFALVLRDDLGGRLRFAAMLFGAFVLSVVVVGWLMYPFPS